MTKRSRITINPRNHGNTRIQQPSRPNPLLLNLSQNDRQPIKPRNRQGFELPPAPTIQAASSSSLMPRNSSKISTNQEWEIDLRQQRQPTFNLRIEFLQAGFPLPRAAKVGKPSFTEFLVNPRRISQNTSPSRSKARITLQEGSKEPNEASTTCMAAPRDPP